MPTLPTANGFIGRVGLGGGNATSYSGIGKTGGIGRLLNRLLNRGHGSRKARATILALTGAAVGGASKAYSNARVSAGRSAGQVGYNELGGKRTIETVAYQTGVTVAGDLTTIDTTIAQKSKPSSYPVEKGGYKPGKIGSLV